MSWELTPRYDTWPLQVKLACADVAANARHAAVAIRRARDRRSELPGVEPARNVCALPTHLPPDRVIRVPEPFRVLLRLKQRREQRSVSNLTVLSRKQFRCGRQLSGADFRALSTRRQTKRKLSASIRDCQAE